MEVTEEQLEALRAALVQFFEEAGIEHTEEGDWYKYSDDDPRLWRNHVEFYLNQERLRLHSNHTIRQIKYHCKNIFGDDRAEAVLALVLG